ncbi:CobW family GTP-binding protein [Caproiciproducens sp.]
MRQSQCDPLGKDRQHHLIPVNVIGGFLGAGKTTFLNYILEQPALGRTDVLIREYGAVPIDDQLVKNVSGKLHVFPGITVHDDPQLVLHDYLHELVGPAEQPGFDRLLLETSGIDSPESLVQLFLVGYMPEHYRLGSYIAVVDAQYGLLNMDEYDVAVRQIAFADAVIVNKIDLADGETVKQLERRIGSVNAMAKIYRASYGRAPLENILEIPLYQQLKDLTAKERAGTVDEIQSVVLVEKRPMNKERVNAWITRLFEQDGPKILRSKGFFCFAGEDWRYEFQGVRKSFHSKAEQLWGPDEERKSTVVLIGEHLPDQKLLQASFSACAE